MPPKACATVSHARQFARGPSRPNGEITATMSSGWRFNSAAASGGRGRRAGRKHYVNSVERAVTIDVRSEIGEHLCAENARLVGKIEDLTTRKRKHRSIRVS